ncbi:diguanylate cyclase [Marinobacter fonticola]|uniref:diguanylate cyclase n=1 Tax=Marinobacter fonticola TaxID=2603215 RepID=UPI0011E7AF52|nr:diguanylate cyclase [Marinobacter fonticola]
MYSAIERLWLQGTRGKSARLTRQIALSNQIGLFGALATLPYQVFYLVYDIGLYWPVFTCNLLFIAVYLSVLLVNRQGYHNQARNLALVNASAQILIVTYFISADAGVHLFYFSIGGIQALMFRRHRTAMLILVLAIIGAFFLICEFLFAVGATPLPEPFIDYVYIVSVTSAIALSGAFSHLFRRDIDEAEDRLISSNRDLEKLSTTDQLTGLANRRSLDRFLDQTSQNGLAGSQMLSVLMCDVDCFKLYNDVYGHQAGDECLRRIAATLTDVVRRPTDLIVRYGGEEFAVVLPGTSESDALVIAERIRAAVDGLRMPHETSTVDDHVTLSIGLSTLGPENTRRARQLFSQADEALYKAKSQGRNRVVIGD